MTDRDIIRGRPTGQHPNPRMRAGAFGGAGQGIETLRRPEGFTNLNMLGRPDLSFRYSHMGPSEGMGVGGTGETRWSDYTTRDGETIRGTWRRTQDARRADEMDEYGYLEGAPRQRTNFYEGYISPQAFNEMYGGVYDDAIFRIVDPNTNRIEQYPQAGITGAMPQERQMAGLIQTWKKIFKNVGEDAANEWLASQQA